MVLADLAHGHVMSNETMGQVSVGTLLQSRLSRNKPGGHLEVVANPLQIPTHCLGEHLSASAGQQAHKAPWYRFRALPLP